MRESHGLAEIGETHVQDLPHAALVESELGILSSNSQSEPSAAGEGPDPGVPSVRCSSVPVWRRQAHGWLLSKLFMNCFTSASKTERSFRSLLMRVTRSLMVFSRPSTMARSFAASCEVYRSTPWAATWA